MKIIHISDLHLGKSVNGYNLLKEGDQPYWCEQFLKLCDEEKPDAVMMAGDIYDRSVPGGEAVSLLDHFLSELADRHIAVMMIAGNHDSPERIDYSHAFLERRGVYTSGVLTRKMKHITLTDAYGPVTFWLLPYLFPLAAAEVLGEEKSYKDTEEAMRAYLDAQDIDWHVRNVLIAHQTVTVQGKEGERGGSETKPGGIGGIDASLFKDFDYTALGHIHAAYPVGSDTIRYCGSILCYHFDETKQKKKGPLIIELGPKGSAPVIRRRTISALHPMRIVEGTFADITKQERTNGLMHEYVSINITDQHISDYITRTMRDIFDEKQSHIMALTSSFEQLHSAEQLEEKAVDLPLDALFSACYTQRHDGTEPDEAERDILHYAASLIIESSPDGSGDEKQAERLYQYLEERKDI